MSKKTEKPKVSSSKKELEKVKRETLGSIVNKAKAKNVKKTKKGNVGYKCKLVSYSKIFIIRVNNNCYFGQGQPVTKPSKLNGNLATFNFTQKLPIFVNTPYITLSIKGINQPEGKDIICDFNISYVSIDEVKFSVLYHKLSKGVKFELTAIGLLPENHIPGADGHIVDLGISTIIGG